MKPLAGKRILITRAKAEPMQSLLEAQGATVLHIPCIQLVDPPDWDPFDQAARQQSEFQFLLVTSPEAVERLFARLKVLGLPLHRSLTIAAVGEKTGAAFLQHGFQADLIPQEFQAEGLLQLFHEADLTEQNFWFPRALQARETLLLGLEGKGAKVHVTPCYQNVLPAENQQQLLQVLEEGLDWIAFASSSSVVQFLELLGEKRSFFRFPKIASIGKVTSQELERHGLNATVTADPQTLEGLVQALLQYEQDHEH